MQITGHRESHGADTGAIDGRARQQRRLRIDLIEILDDGEGLRDCRSIDLQSRHQSLWIQRKVFGCAVPWYRRAEVYMHGLVVHALQVDSDARPICGGASEVSVELHHAAPPLTCRGPIELRSVSRPSIPHSIRSPGFSGATPA